MAQTVKSYCLFVKQVTSDLIDIQQVAGDHLRRPPLIFSGCGMMAPTLCFLGSRKSREPGKKNPVVGSVLAELNDLYMQTPVYVCLATLGRGAKLSTSAGQHGVTKLATIRCGGEVLTNRRRF